MSEIRHERQMLRPKAPPRPKKPKRPGDSKAYLDMIRQLPCAVDRVYGPARMDPHHQDNLFPDRGGQAKVEDRYCIPLSRRRHTQLHSISSPLHADVLLAWGVDGRTLANTLWQIFQTDPDPLEAMRDAVLNHEGGK